MKTLWKSSRLIYKCSNFALFCCQKSNSFRPRHRALIEGVIFLKYINAVYVIFFSYRGRWYLMSENFWKTVCVYTWYKKGFPFKRLWVVMVATLGLSQSERSIFSLDQSETRISPMWLIWRHYTPYMVIKFTWPPWNKEHTHTRVESTFLA